MVKLSSGLTVSKGGRVYKLRSGVVLELNWRTSDSSALQFDAFHALLPPDKSAPHSDTHKSPELEELRNYNSGLNSRICPSIPESPGAPLASDAIDH